MMSKKLKCKKRDAGNVEDEDIPLKSMNLPSKRPHDEDRLTSLHDSLVAHILSYLCTRDAIRTSTLCREWKYKWTLSYNVSMSDCYKEISTRTFVNVMDRILISAGLKLRNFHLICHDDNYSSRLQLWISTALTHDLESFILSVHYIPTEARIVFPRSLINSTSLQILKLKFFIRKSKIILNVAMHNFVPRLTSLNLENLEIELNGGDSSSSIVTFKFDVLKELELKETKWVNVKSVEIYAPCLTRLKSVDRPYQRQLPDYSIVVNAPMLTMFETGGYMIPDNIRILNGNSVTYARITGISETHADPQLGIKVGLQIRNRFREFTSLEILELWDSFAYVTASAETALYRFDHLRELTVMLWHNNRVGDLVGDLFQLLYATPTLKFLKVNVGLTEEKRTMILTEGPWQLGESFPTVRQWVPNFRADTDKMETTITWVRILNLPMEMFRESVIESLAACIGDPLKIDGHTFKASKGRLARFCVEVKTSKPLELGLYICGKVYQAVYENIPSLCHGCGRVGHTIGECKLTPPTEPTSRGGLRNSLPLVLNHQWMLLHKPQLPDGESQE